MANEDPARDDLARLLNEARERHHLSIRAAAKIAGVPAATAQGWLSGKHLPTPALRRNFEHLLEALDLADLVSDDLWSAPLTLRQPLDAASAPYRGLRPFGIDDAAFFKGRDREAARLANAVKAMPESRGIVALVGPSGSGKSSLLAAGLIAGQCTDGDLAGWRAETVDVTKPETWSATAADLVVIDQCEDAFVSDGAGVPGDAWDQALADLAGRCVVVIGLRSDAFAAAAERPLIAEALRRPVLLAAMTNDELKEAIVLPAEAVGVTVEDDLVAVLAEDAVPPGRGRGATADALPLLSNALLLTWAASDGRRLTLADYRRIGGLGTAIETLAEEVFGSLTHEQQETAENLLLRLTHSVNDALVRASLPLQALDATVAPVAARFVEARLLTVADETLRISHDALLTHWRRLQEWVERRGDDLRVRAQLANATALWVANDRNPHSLLAVQRLPQVSSWLDDPTRRGLLTADETDFLDRSRDHFASQLDIERRTSRTLRRQRRVAVTLAVMAACLALVAGGAFLQGRQIQLAAQSRQIALQASNIRSRDANLQAQMALVADRTAATREGLSTLLDATAVDVPLRWPGTGSGVLATSEDGTLVVRGAGGGQVTLWRGAEIDTSSGTTWTADPAGNQLFSVAFGSHEGRQLLAVGGAKGFAALWDVTGQPRVLATLASDPVATTYTAVFSRDGAQLALGDSAGAVRLFSLANLASPSVTAQASLPTGAVSGLAFDAEASTLYASGTPGLIARWAATAGTLSPLPALDFSVEGFGDIRAQCIGLSPNGRWLVAGLAASASLRWDLSAPTPAPVANRTYTSWVNSVVFADDSASYLTGDSGQRVQVFDSADDAVEKQLTGPSLFTGAAFAGGRTVAVSADGAVRVWGAERRVLRYGGKRLNQLATDPAGSQWLAAASTGDNRMLLWRISDNYRSVADPVVPSGRKLYAATTMSPTGDRLFGSSRTGEIIEWPLTDAGAGAPVVHSVGDASARIGWVALDPKQQLLAANDHVTGKTILMSTRSSQWERLAVLATAPSQMASFSPDGSLLQVGVGDGQVQLWSMTDPAEPRLVSSIPVDSNPAVSMFFPRSPWLLIGTGNGTVSVWDVSVPETPREIRHYTDPQAGIYAAVITPDESRIIVGGGDELYWGWDLTKPAQGADLVLDGQMGRTVELRLTKGGATLVGAGASGTVRMWELDATKARTQLCAQRGEPLTAEEWTRYLPGVPAADPCA